MKHRVAMLPTALLLGITLLGCEPPTPVSSGPPAAPPPPGSAPPPPPPAAPAPAAAPLPPETKFGVFAGDVNDLAARPSASQPAQPSSLPPPEPGTERVKAQAGVGAKGRSLDNEQGLLVTPVKAFFAAKERIAFEQAFYGQYRLYRATEDAPKDYAELKAKVLDPYLIKLPPLPPGHKYVWDAANEVLQVERPKRQ
ncbi:MAG TPA: hypothetical protein VGI40_11600 [Pirellulaceae bacterium]